MVDMGGIDLAKDTGEAVPGIYSKIEEAVNNCGDVVLYNWKFAGIEITPQYTSISPGNPIVINGVINVYSNDIISVIGVTPDPPVLVPLSVEENGQFSPQEYDADGFNIVTVEVPGPNLEVLTATRNGVEYLPSPGYQGFSKVIVDIQGGPPTFSVNVTGGYNGGARIEVKEGAVTRFTATGNSPYNLHYTPNSLTFESYGGTTTINIPDLPNSSSRLVIQMTWGGVTKTAEFMHIGNNSSYGYGDQTVIIDFNE